MIAAPGPPINEIVRAIVDAVHPRRVVLFGSHARGDARPDSDVDLMIEVDVEPNRHERYEREATIRSLTRASGWQVDPKVYASAWVERWRDDPGTMAYDIVRQGKELYCRDDAASASKPVVRERPTRPESLRDWVFRADEDIGIIDDQLAGARVRWGPVCFHAQQAAEKYLKALLILRYKRPDRTHDLLALLADCRAAGYSMPGLDGDCSLLLPFAITARYPDDEGRPSPTPLEGQAAVDACRRIVAAARPFLSSG